MGDACTLLPPPSPERLTAPVPITGSRITDTSSWIHSPDFRPRPPETTTFADPNSGRADSAISAPTNSVAPAISLAAASSSSPTASTIASPPTLAAVSATASAAKDVVRTCELHTSCAASPCKPQGRAAAPEDPRGKQQAEMPHRQHLDCLLGSLDCAECIACINWPAEVCFHPVSGTTHQMPLL